MKVKATGHERLKQALTMAETVKTVLVATADGDGCPHVAVAGRIDSLPDGRVTVSEWFCPGTVSNLEKNPRISLVVWQSVSDTGYQLTGEVEQVEELAFLDGYLPEGEGTRPLPQTRRRLTVRVTTVIPFSRAPHTDEED
jgi:predicted pyridoxine 5'-phosphate oxidase superfamily flavin-nucleotide-binding protein